MNTIAQLVAHHAEFRPHDIAFVEAGTGRSLTWHDYDAQARALARRLLGMERGTRIALHIHDGIDMHIAMVACELAGIVGVGIGARAGAREIDHLVEVTAARFVVATLEELAACSSSDASQELRPFDADELWFLNSTSGTTGLPKCVMHNQRRWFAFHELAKGSARFTNNDVMMSLLPAPFGFGLWTSHFTPTILGIPCVILDRYTPSAASAAIEHHGVSILAAVSTQFVIMLNDPTLHGVNTSALRVLFTGGEMVPPTRAKEWEDVTGSRVLQFYGSNETGALSYTSLDDNELVRLHTAGHVIQDLDVRLLDPETGADITMTGGPGIAACRGVVNCLGYFNDDAANRDLVTDDGWMRTGDLCTIDEHGVLTVAGRASDFIIRGGKNISATAVEQACATMPGVDAAAAVAKSDPTFGERVCVFCVLRPDQNDFSLASLCSHLERQGVGKEYWPEYLVLRREPLPVSSGGKVAKGELRTIATALPIRI